MPKSEVLRRFPPSEGDISGSISLSVTAGAARLQNTQQQQRSFVSRTNVYVKRVCIWFPCFHVLAWILIVKHFNRYFSSTGLFVHELRPQRTTLAYRLCSNLLFAPLSCLLHLIKIIRPLVCKVYTTNTQQSPSIKIPHQISGGLFSFFTAHQV